MEYFKQLIQNCRVKYEKNTSLQIQASKREILFDMEEKLKTLTTREIYNLSKEICEVFIILASSQSGQHLSQDIATLCKLYKIETHSIFNELLKLPLKPQLITLCALILDKAPVMGPPAREIFDMLIKQKQIDAKSLKLVHSLIQSGHLMQYQETVIKSLVKVLPNSDRELRQVISGCLTSACQEYPSTYVSWSTLWPELINQALKDIEICQQPSLLLALLQARLNESKQLGDLKTPNKVFIQKDQKKKIDFPRTLQEVVIFLAVQKIDSGSVLISMLQNNSLEYLQSDVLASILLVTKNPKFLQILSLKELNQRELVEFCLQSLKTQQMLIKPEILQELQSLSKNTKIGTTVGSTQTCFVLSLLSKLLYKIEMQKCSDYFDLILPLLSIPNVRQSAVEVVQSISENMPQWNQQMTSTLLSNVQSTQADLQCMKQQSQNLIESLNGLSQALACLIKSTVLAIGGEPVVIAQQTFNVASQLIVGVGYTFEKYLALEFHQVKMRNEAGWTLLQGLMHIGPNWIQKNINELINLFKTVFSKSMCQVEESKDQIYTEQLKQEIKVKSAAIAALQVLLSTVELQQEHQKVFAILVTYAFPFIFLKQNTNKLSQQNLLFCLNKLPVHYYKSKFNSILHQVSDTIVEENVDCCTINEVDNLDGNADSQNMLVQLGIGVFVKILASDSLNEKNKDQLAKHLTVHAAQSVKTDKVTQSKILLPYRPDKIRKIGRIGKTVYEYLQIQDRANYQNEAQMVKDVINNLMAPDLNGKFAILASEIQVAFQVKQIDHLGVGPFLEILEMNLSGSIKSKNVSQLMFISAQCGHLVRYYGYEIPFERLTNIFYKLLSHQDPRVQKISLHFASDICLESREFTKQILPLCFDVVYSSQFDYRQQTIRLLQGLNMWEDLKIAKILIQDHISEPTVLYSLAQKNEDVLQYVEFLDQSHGKLVELLVSQHHLPRLQQKFKNFDQQVIEFVNLDLIKGHSPWLNVYKMLVERLNQSEHAQLIKHSIAQNHDGGTVSFATMMEFLKIFKFSLSKYMESSQAIELLQFALTLVSQKQREIKEIAVEFITLCINQMREKTEAADEESLSPRTLMQTPLIIEQYEAQIFSVIRQTLASDEQVILKVFDLVYTFITLPVTQDPSLVKKIVQMLTLNIHKQIKCDVLCHEGLAVLTHFIKLELLAKLWLKSQSDCHLQRFNEDHRQQLSDLFDNKLMATLISSWRIAAQDCLILSLNGDGNQTMLKFVQGTVDVQAVCETAPTIIQALMEFDQDDLTQACLLQGLVGAYDGVSDLQRFYNQKISYLRLLKTNKNYLQELIPVLQHLSMLGIIEINGEILQIYSQAFDDKVQFDSDVLDAMVEFLLQFQPELRKGTTAYDPQLIKTWLNCLGWACKKSKNYDLTIGVILSKICMGINEISTELHQDYIKFIKDIVNSIVDPTDEISKMATQIIFQMNQQTLCKSQARAMSLVIKLVTGKDQQAVCGLLDRLDVQVDFTELTDLQLNQLTLQLAKIAFVMAYNNINSTNWSFMLKTYAKLDADMRCDLLLPYLALIFQVIQTQDVDGNLKLQAVTNLIEVVKTDQIALKNFASKRCVLGLPMLTPSEQTLIENVVRNYQAKVGAS